MTMRLGIVIPCYNEDEVLPDTSRRITELLRRLAPQGKISPGSSDGTWQLIEALVAGDRRTVGVKLAEVEARPRFFIERIASQASPQRPHGTPAAPAEKSAGAVRS